MKKFNLHREELWPFYELLPHEEGKTPAATSAHFAFYMDVVIELDDEKVAWIERVHKELAEVQQYLRQFDDRD